MALSESHRRHLLLGGALAGPLFLTVSTVHGAVLPHYNARRHPVSSLALGPHGWLQRANFLTAGCLYGGLAVALWHAGPPTRAGPVLVGAAAAGLLGAGTFLTDPVSGYPPGTPDALPGYSGTAAALHDALSIPTFLGLPAAAAIYARSFARQGRRGWALCSGGTAAVMLTAFGLASAGFSQAPALVGHGGLYQRAAVTTGFAWLTALAGQTVRGSVRQPGRSTRRASSGEG